MYDAIIMGVRTFGIAGADEGFGKPGGGCDGCFGFGKSGATEPRHALAQIMAKAKNAKGSGDGA